MRCCLRTCTQCRCLRQSASTTACQRFHVLVTLPPSVRIHTLPPSHPLLHCSLYHSSTRLACVCTLLTLSQAVEGLQGCRVGIVFTAMANATISSNNVRYQLRFEATPGGYRKDSNNDITGVEQFLPGATWLTDKAFPLFAVLGPRSDIELYAPQTPDKYGNAPGYYKVGSQRTHGHHPHCTRWKPLCY